MEIIDIYDGFKTRYENLNNKSVENTFKIWNEYISEFPEIKEMIVQTYREDRVYEIFDIFEKYIYPIFNDKWNKFDLAHDNLIRYLKQSKDKIEDLIDEKFYVISFIGLGTGAGHVDKYKNKPAVYFGIEKIVDLNWYQNSELQDLIYHEIGHILHMILRGKDWLTKRMFKKQSDYLYWILYEEGFAQRFSQKIMEKDYYHQGNQTDWKEWCEINLPKLCTEYIRYAEEGKDEFEFFGDWFDIDGYSETGYFIGTQLIKKLEKDMSLKEIAKMNLIEIKNEVYDFLFECSYGLKNGYVVVSPYTEVWKKAYQIEKSRIMENIPEVRNIEHIGSTAVEELSAKPIIDIMIGYENDLDKENIIEKLKDLNYTFFGENGITDRYFFKYTTEDKVTKFHIHLAKFESDFWIRHLRFRDHLRNNKNNREYYAEIKEKLSRKAFSNREKYVQDKDEFIKKIVENIDY